MKKLITLILGLIIIGPAYAQAKVDNFYSAVSADPENTIVNVINVMYKNYEFDSLQTQSVKNQKPPKDIRTDVKLRGEAIDKAKLINYMSDTLYILTTFYPQDDSKTTTIKTHKGIYDLIHGEGEKYEVRPAEDRYKSYSSKYRGDIVKLSDFTLYNALFTWDMDQLKQIFKASGGGGSTAYETIRATRIIIKNNKVSKKDVMYFKPASRWKLEDPKITK